MVKPHVAKALNGAVKDILQEAFNQGLSFNKAHDLLKGRGYKGKAGYRRQDLQEYWRAFTTRKISESAYRFVFFAKSVMGESIFEELREVKKDWYDKVKVAGSSRSRLWSEQDLVDDITTLSWPDGTPTIIIHVIQIKTRPTQAEIKKGVRQAIEQASIDGFDFMADCSIQQTKLGLCYLGALLTIADSRPNVFQEVGYMLNSTGTRNKNLQKYLLQVFNYVR